MRLTPLYRLNFRLERTWVSHRSGGETQVHCVDTATGNCAGGIQGRFRGFDQLPPEPTLARGTRLRGMIETDEGERLLVNYQVSYKSRLEGGYQIVGTAQHASGSDAYGWLNGQLYAVAGELRRGGEGRAEIVLEIEEVTWEPVEGGSKRA